MELFCFHRFAIKSTFLFMNAECCIIWCRNRSTKGFMKTGQSEYVCALYRCVSRVESAQCTNWNWCNTYRSKLHTSNWHNIAAKHLLFSTFLIMHETFIFLFQAVLRIESVFFSLYPPSPLTSEKNSQFWDNGVVFYTFSKPESESKTWNGCLRDSEYA